MKLHRWRHYINESLPFLTGIEFVFVYDINHNDSPVLSAKVFIMYLI